MKTILLIEDNLEIRENMAEIMELAGYKVLTAADGKEGLSMAFQEKPDLIICDIMMPILDGYGVIHTLQKNKETQNVPFIFLTAKAERAEMRRGMEMGADDYITKPFSGAELLSAVETRLRRVDSLKEELSGNIEKVNDLLTKVGSKELLEDFTKDRVVAKYKKKQIIYSEGNRPHRMYYIHRGKVKAYRTNNDGKEYITELYKEGDFFGYIAMLEDAVYKETAEVMEEAELAIIARDDFEKLINNNAEVMKQFIKVLANNVTERESQLLGMAYNSLRKKVAESILAIRKKLFANTETPMNISRENLANIAGTAKESVIRTLHDFKDEKLIDIVEGDIIILNEKKLKELAN